MITICCGDYGSALKENGDMLILPNPRITDGDTYDIFYSRSWAKDDIIFTNSELAIMSLRLAVKDKLIKHSDIVIMFYPLNDKAIPIFISWEGHLSERPNGFFDVRGELVDRLMGVVDMEVYQ